MENNIKSAVADAMQKLAYEFMVKHEHGFPDDYDECVYIMAQFGVFIASQFKQQEEIVGLKPFQDKPLYEGAFKKILNLYSLGQTGDLNGISFSRMVEMINEIAIKWHESKQQVLVVSEEYLNELIDSIDTLARRYDNSDYGLSSDDDEMKKYRRTIKEWLSKLSLPVDKEGKKLLKVSEMKDLEKQVSTGAISYSRMVEIINEKYIK